MSLALKNKLVSILFLFLVFFLNGGQGSDHLVYSNYWENPSDEFELGFKYLTIIFSSLGISYEIFRACAVGLLFYVISLNFSSISKRLYPPVIFAILIVFDDYGLTRQLIAITLIFVGILRNSWFIPFVSLTVHVSTLIMGLFLIHKKVLSWGLLLLTASTTFISLYSVQLVAPALRFVSEDFYIRIATYTEWNVGFLYGPWLFMGLIKYIIYLLVYFTLFDSKIISHSLVSVKFNNLFFGLVGVYFGSIFLAPAVSARFSVAITLIYFFNICNLVHRSDLGWKYVRLSAGVELLSLIANMNWGED